MTTAHGDVREIGEEVRQELRRRPPDMDPVP